MALDRKTRQRLERLVDKERAARAENQAARAELVVALKEARDNKATVRELAKVVGMSHQLVFHLTRD